MPSLYTKYILELYMVPLKIRCYLQSLFPSKWMYICSDSSNSLQPHECQPTRLPCTWDFPGKNTGMGCHFLLQGIFPIQGSNLSLLSPALAGRFSTTSATSKWDQHQLGVQAERSSSVSSWLACRSQVSLFSLSNCI